MTDNIYIIAEAGVNHNGSLERAEQMVAVAAQAGADAIKFQTFKADSLVSKNAPKAGYQLQTTELQESQYEMLKKLELNTAEHKKLIQCCKENSIEFLSTPFDKESLDVLINVCDLKVIKIPSGEITNAPFLLEIAKTKRPVILSTGMSTLGEIELALSVLAFGYLSVEERPSVDNFRKSYGSRVGQEILRQNVKILHCTTEYPAPLADVNLNCMKTIAATFGLPVGYSDHTAGIVVPLAAAACGAKVIEKHFTLDKNLSGPDHKASLNPAELDAMVRGIRQIEIAMGDGIKYPRESEFKNINIVRKSLVAKDAIYKGETFTEANIAVKRPGNGKSPFAYWDVIGKKAEHDYMPEDRI